MIRDTTARQTSTLLKNSFRFFLLLAFALGGSRLSASAQNNQGASTGIKTDLAVYNEPAPPPLPAAGGKFIDPTFGTELMRVTDATGGGNASTAYSYWPTFNRDNTRLLVERDGVTSGELYDFDPVSFTLGAKHTIPGLPGGGVIRGEDAIWSSRNPDVLFGHTDGGAQLWAYNVRAGTFTMIGDLSSRLLPGGASLFQMSKSDDDDVFAATVRAGDPTWSFLGYVVYRASTGTVLSESVAVIDECQIDKSGRYLYVQTNQQGAGQIYGRVLDVATGVMTDLVDDGPDHAPGHEDAGTGIVVGGSHYLNSINKRSYDSPHTFTNVLSAPDYSQGTHVSMRADNENWVLMEWYTANNLASTGIFRNEITQIRTDGSQQVRRLLHHHSVYYAGGQTDYYGTPRANISRDGRFIAFTSNWGNINGRHDLFVARIPPADGDVPTPTPTPVSIAAAASFIRQDATTQGSWKGVYGSDGYHVVNDTSNLPAYAQVSEGGNQSWTWAASTSNAQALQKALLNDRIAATWCANAAFTIEVNFTDGNRHQVALYALDYDRDGRTESVDVLDATSGAVLDSQSISGFSQGRYLVWDVAGHVRFRITRTVGANAVISGLFFQSAASTSTPTPTPTATPTPTPTPTPIPTPTPSLMSPILVSQAFANAVTLANTSGVSSDQILSLAANIAQARAALAAESSSFSSAAQIDRSLRCAFYFTRAAAALSAASAPGDAVQSRLVVAAARLQQSRDLMQQVGVASPVTLSSLVANTDIGSTDARSGASFAPLISAASLGTLNAQGALTPLSARTQTATSASLPLELAGASVTVGGYAASLVYVSPTRIDFVVPANVAAGDAEVIVTSQEGYVSRGTVSVAQVAPGLFTASGDGVGSALALNSWDYTPGAFDTTSAHYYGADNAARVMIYATGIRGASNTNTGNDVRQPDGSIITNYAESISVQARTADGRVFQLPVEFAGAAGGLAGIDQLTLRIAPELRGAGAVDLTITVAGQTSNRATITIR
jgi:uncharacterized protein (TIGR03437 family)